jgi:ABC-type Fe3+-hydroxamate transport system substrate-binding protein
METIVRFHKTEEAYLFRSYLESEGIPAHVFDEHIPQLFWTYTMLIGGIRVVVAKEDSEAASELFREYESRVNAEPATMGAVKFWPLVLIATFAIGGPFMIFGRNPPDSGSGNP